MRIVKVVVEKLFGYLNYTIPLYDMVTIIHGLNGSGKTTMLRIINAVFNDEIRTLYDIEFHSVEFTLSNGDSFQIIKDSTLAGEEPGNQFSYEYLFVKWKKDGQRKEYNPYEQYSYQSFHVRLTDYLEKTNRPLPYLRKTGPDEWLNLRTGTTLTNPEVIEKYGEAIASRMNVDFPEFQLPEEVQDMIRQTAVFFIKTDRLTCEKMEEFPYNGRIEHKTVRRVKQVAEQLSQKIKDAIQYYAKVSQEKDRTFPFRTIQRESAAPAMTAEEIKKKILQLEEKRKELTENGVLEDTNSTGDFQSLVDGMNDRNLQNLTLYVQDTSEKLDTLTSLSASINQFRRLIESSFDSRKKIQFSKENGFSFLSKDLNAPIPLEKLSSGEQHEIVMFYDLIFNSKKDELVLIDEPELSLHISWQMEFVNELMEIIQANHFYVVLSTHAPQIVNGNWDIAVKLSENSHAEKQTADSTDAEEDSWDLDEEEEDGEQS